MIVNLTNGTSLFCTYTQQAIGNIQFEYWSVLIAGLALLFTLVTYWINKIVLWRKNQWLKKQLNTEFRTVYLAVRKDILMYNKYKTQPQPMSEFVLSFHPTTIMNYVLNSGKFITFFKTPEDAACFTLLIQEINLADKFDKRFFSPPRSQMVDFYIKKRISEIRERLLELGENKNFVDMNIVPKYMVNKPWSTQLTQQYEQLQRDEENALDTIRQYVGINARAQKFQ